MIAHDAMIWNNKQFGSSADVHSIMLYYNKDLLSAHNVEVLTIALNYCGGEKDATKLIVVGDLLLIYNVASEYIYHGFISKWW